jgi:RNA polymerase sigma-70 factor (ECF subfamily)
MIFIRIFQNLDKYSGNVPLQHWISRVAVNTCLNELRAEKRRPEWRLADFDEGTAAAIERLARTESETATPDDARMAKDLLTRLLGQLSPDDRLLVTWLHLEERSIQEIHSLTGWSRAAIKVRAFRARAKLKKMLGQSATLEMAFAA